MSIKKVVIPQIEIKYVCILTEGEIQNVINNKDINNPYSIYPYQLSNFKRQETIKPLADDEVSIEDVDINKYIYASAPVEGNHRNNGIELWISSGKCTVKATCFCQWKGYQHYSSNSDEFNILYIFKERLKNKVIYQFETQQEFFEWALKQIKGNLND